MFFSGSWLLYQIRKTSILINSVISTNVLNLENAQAQYIYVDDPKFDGKIYTSINE